MLDKPYSDPQKTELLGYFCSGKHKRTVKGINLISLYYTDVTGTSDPVNFRIYDKREGKTKNEYFREMVAQVQAWGRDVSGQILCPENPLLKLAWVSGDSWYSGIENLKFLRNLKVGFLFGIADNRGCLARTRHSSTGANTNHV